MSLFTRIQNALWWISTHSPFQGNQVLNEGFGGFVMGLLCFGNLPAYCVWTVLSLTYEKFFDKAGFSMDDVTQRQVGMILGWVLGKLLT